MNITGKNFKRGDVVIANLDSLERKTSLQQGVRPVVIISNERCNRHSPVLTIVPLTSSVRKPKLPTHVSVCRLDIGTEQDSIALCEQQMAVDRDRLLYKVGSCPEDVMRSIDKSILIQLGFLKGDEKDESRAVSRTI